MPLRILLGCAALGALLLAPIAASANFVLSMGGIVDGQGHVVAGSGFTAVRTSTGSYTLSFPAHSFRSPPAFTCSGAGANGGAPICIIFGYGYNKTGTTTVNVLIVNPSGQAQDNAFHFTEVTTH
jgi:hypothetical protein